MFECCINPFVEITEVDDKVTRIGMDQTQFVQDMKREKLKENSRITVEMQKNHNAIKEAENKVSNQFTEFSTDIFRLIFFKLEF